MMKKIKEGFSHFSGKKIYFVISLALVGVTLPFYFTYGQLIGESASNIANSIAGVFLFVLATASYAFSTLADWFLRLTLDTDFITARFTPLFETTTDIESLPYGEEDGNQFVGYGWTVIRDFVNMFFIIVLVIIGLSTSLQVETYRWQKTLPRLIGVALLINFTPAILGVFIDTSNFIMNHFIGQEGSFARESVFVARMRPLYDNLSSSLDGVSWARYTSEAISPMATTVLFTFFNTVVGFTYLLYAGIFALRYVALWLLIIISPFGFFCYILPATQDIFRTWWKWFVGWCLAGIAAALFLHLG